jgi:hypothetical protein
VVWRGVGCFGQWVGWVVLGRMYGMCGGNGWMGIGWMDGWMGGWFRVGFRPLLPLLLFADA